MESKYYAHEYERRYGNEVYEGVEFIDTPELCKQIAAVLRKAGVPSRAVILKENDTFIQRNLLLTRVGVWENDTNGANRVYSGKSYYNGWMKDTYDWNIVENVLAFYNVEYY